MLQSFDQITTLTYVLLDIFCPVIYVLFTLLTIVIAIVVALKGDSNKFHLNLVSSKKEQQLLWQNLEEQMRSNAEKKP